MDLYRLSGKPQDLLPLNLDHVFANDIALVEWPTRLGDRIPPEVLDLQLRIHNDDSHDGQEDIEFCARKVVLRPHGQTWTDRIEFLIGEGMVDDLLLEDGITTKKDD